MFFAWHLDRSQELPQGQRPRGPSGGGLGATEVMFLAEVEQNEERPW
jgi:hypothetical protein